MIGVDKIDAIGAPTLSSTGRSRKAFESCLRCAMVREIIRSHKAKRKCERSVWPMPKLGDWLEALAADNTPSPFRDGAKATWG